MMKASADNVILVLILSLTVAAASVIVWQPFEFDHVATVGREFQSALGGLGMGCDVDLTRCSWQFDARIADDEEFGLGGDPCLSELSPWHSISIFPAPTESLAVDGV